jgi:hypothetical protein
MKKIPVRIGQMPQDGVSLKHMKAAHDVSEGNAASFDDMEKTLKVIKEWLLHGSALVSKQRTMSDLKKTISVLEKSVYYGKQEKRAKEICDKYKVVLAHVSEMDDGEFFDPDWF